MFPMSLFIQVSSLPMADNGAEVRKWFDKILSEHKRKGSPHHIHDLALSEIASVDSKTGAITLAEEQLNVIKNYLPHFGNVFVGTVPVTYPHPHATGLTHPDPYMTGIQDENFRWKCIYASREAARQYVTAFWHSGIHANLHWYISYEADLNALTDDGVKEAYKAYIKQLTEDLTNINNNNPQLNGEPAFLWSPNFFKRFKDVSGPEKGKLIGNLQNLFDGAPKLNWLHFQDNIGQTSRKQSDGSVKYDFTADDAIRYYSEVFVPVNSAGRLKSVLINMEHFVMDDNNGIYPGDPLEQAERHCAYRRASIPVGFSWEIRWWYRSLYGD